MQARSGASQLRVRVEAVAGAELRRWLYVRTVAVAAVCRKKTNARRSGRVRNRRERGSTKGWVHRGRVHRGWEHGGLGGGGAQLPLPSIIGASSTPTEEPASIWPY